jgi:hypothetical protein
VITNADGLAAQCFCGFGHDDGWARESPARAAASTTRA